jgi:hypothetical protein
MSLSSELRKRFSEDKFGHPCDESQFVTAEKALGHLLPPILVDLYRNFDGFRGPTDAEFLYPLLLPRRSTATSLVEHTKFLRSADYSPRFIQRTVAVGDTGIGPCWLLEIDSPKRLLWWDAEWGEDYEVVPYGLPEAWYRAKEDYDSLLRERER